MSTDYLFKGYLFDENGMHSGAIYLKDALEALRLIHKNKTKHKEIMITDTDDFIVVHQVEGKIACPKPLNEFGYDYCKEVCKKCP